MPEGVPEPSGATESQETPVEIVGLVKKGKSFNVVVRYLDDVAVYVMPPSDARKRFPVQLSLFYEKHVKFV